MGLAGGMAGAAIAELIVKMMEIQSQQQRANQPAPGNLEPPLIIPMQDKLFVGVFGFLAGASAEAAAKEFKRAGLLPVGDRAGA